MKILGISAFYHDSAAAIIEDGVIVAAAQEERFTRIKHDPGFPTQAIQFCLEETNLELSQLDAIAFYDKPLLKFERLLETYYAFAPKGIQSFIRAIPVWIKEKMFLKRIIREEFNKIGDYGKTPILFPEHHLSHAASAFFPSNFQNSAILTIDGVGEWATASICHGIGNSIEIKKELKFPHSLGLLYSAFTYFLGFKVNSGEYKLMGLAPYGNEGERTNDFVNKIKNELIKIYDDGSVWLNQKYFNYATGLRMANDKRWEKLFGIPKRKSESEFEQVHCDLGLAIQKVTEEVVIKLAEEAKRLTGEETVCLAGGVALNCVANGKLQKSGVFKNVFIQPAAGDAGGAIGAALAAYHIKFEKERSISDQADQMFGSYLGPDVKNKDVLKVIRKYAAVSKHFESFNNLTKEIAKYLDDGKVIGWMQGKMEFGPRALGNRSILGDPRNPEMQKKLNLKIKYRESFRPFAPSVMAPKAAEYFDLDGTSPYMLLVQPVQDSIRKPKPAGYDDLDIKNKLYFERSSLPAITHIDYSARIQTVHPETNNRYYSLIESFEKLTGCGVIINTSFNVRGEPIVCTPEDAYRCFMRTEMDVLVTGDHVFIKEDQPSFEDQSNWKEEFVLD